MAGLEQEGYRFRNDDGDEALATWKAAQDSNISLPAGSKTRLRMLINATGDLAARDFQLEWHKKGSTDPWRKIGGGASETSLLINNAQKSIISPETNIIQVQNLALINAIENQNASSPTVSSSGGGPPTLVQSCQNSSGDGVEVTSLTVGGTGWTSNNTPGNLIVVMAMVSSETLEDFTFDVADCVDDKSGGSNVYTLDKAYDIVTNNASPGVAIWSTISGASGQKLTVTVTTDISMVITLFAAEFSGIASSSYVLNTAGTTVYDAGNPTFNLTVTTIGNLVLGCLGTWFTQSRDYAQGSGYTIIQEQTAAANWQDGNSQYKVATATGAQAVNWVLETATNWTGCAVEYKQA